MEICDRTLTCLRLFEGCLSIPRLMHNEWAENRLADLNLWAAGLGASIHGKYSLDARLQHRADIRDTTINMLHVLELLIRQCEQECRDEPPQGVIDNSTATHLFPGTLFDSIRLQKSIAAIQDVLTQLARLSMIIRKSGTRMRYQLADQTFKPSDYQDFRDYLETPLRWDTSKSRLLALEDLTDIQKRLVLTTTKRRHRLIQSQLRAVRLEEDPRPLERPIASEPLQLSLVAKTESTAASRTQNLESMKETMPEKSLATTRPILESDAGATAVPSDVVLPKLRASTPSAVSRLTSTGASLDYPPPPPINSQVSTFRCPYCHQVLLNDVANNKGQWRKHVTEDLYPYTCIFEPCPKAYDLYLTSKDWLQHMEDTHRVPRWLCQICRGIGKYLYLDSIPEFESHTMEVHGTNTAKAKMGIMAKLSYRPAQLQFEKCPLRPCSWRADEDITLLDHIAKHIHSFSLKALPWPLDDENGISESGDYKPNSTSQGLSIAEDQDLTGFDYATGQITYEEIDQTSAVSDISTVKLTEANLQILRTNLRDETPIRELWNEVYEELKAGKNADLVASYEAALSRNMTDLSNEEVVLSTSKTQRKEQMTRFCELKLAAIVKQRWTYSLHLDKQEIKEMEVLTYSIITWAQVYLENVSATPNYSSLAWSGVLILLSIFMSQRHSALIITPLNRISEMISRGLAMEEFYRRLLEFGASDSRPISGYLQPQFKSHLKALYLAILQFEMGSIEEYHIPAMKQITLSIKQQENYYNPSLIYTRERELNNILRLWTDTQYEEDCAKMQEQHRYRMEKTSTGRKVTFRDDTSDLRDSIMKAQRTSLLKWLSSTDPSQNYNAARSKHVGTTGEWLTNARDFILWKDSPCSIFWLHGIAGSGKTILSSCVINHLKEQYSWDPSVAIAFWYFSFNDTQKRNISSMLGSLITQLCSQRPDIPNAVRDLKKYNDEGKPPDHQAFEIALTATIKEFSRVYLVIDALDECSDLQGLIDIIRHLNKISSLNWHLFLTSRTEIDIKPDLWPLASRILSLSSFRRFLDPDIDQYIQQELASIRFASWPPDFKEKAASTLKQRANGMFIYVSLQLAQLEHQPSLAHARETLENLPEGLDTLYDRMLLSIDLKYWDRVKDVLKWLVCSLRLLTLSEFAEVFILKPMVIFDENDRLTSTKDLLPILRGLVTTSEIRIERPGSIWHGEKDIEVQLMHFSITEYLLSQRIRTGPAAAFAILDDTHTLLAGLCLEYHIQVSNREVVTKETVKRFCLWEYAATSWALHLEKTIGGRKHWPDSVKNNAQSVFKPASNLFQNMIRFADPTNEGNYSNVIQLDRIPTPLYYCAFFGLTEMAHFLFDCGVVETRQSYDRALQVAAVRGHRLLVNLFTNKGADVNASVEPYGTALNAAVFGGDITTVQFLLGAGANVNTQLDEGGNALLTAAALGNYGIDARTRIVDELLKRGANVNCLSNGQYRSALQAAAAKINLPIVKQLLKAGADANQMRDEYKVVIQAAEASGNTELVDYLGGWGIDNDNVHGGDDGGKREALQDLFHDVQTEPDRYKQTLSRAWISRYMDASESLTERILQSHSSSSNHFERSRVKVAILDTGVTLNDPHIHGASDRIMGFMDWVDGRQGKDTQASVHDNVGHGTHVTRLLLELAPQANIYISRVVDRSVSKTTAELIIAADRIANAIKHAVDVWGVDIIIIPVAFRQRFEVIAEAIEHAFTRNVIIFAPTSLNGRNRNVMFPATLSQLMIGTSSTDGHGQKSSFNPKTLPLSENFSTLGEVIDSLSPVQSKCRSGAFQATIIAAGIAVNTLFYARMNIENPRIVNKAATCQGMKTLLLAMSSLRDGYNYICPWTLWEKEDAIIVAEIIRALGEMPD